MVDISVLNHKGHEEHKGNDSEGVVWGKSGSTAEAQSRFSRSFGGSWFSKMLGADGWGGPVSAGHQSHLGVRAIQGATQKPSPRIATAFPAPESAENPGKLCASVTLW